MADRPPRAVFYREMKKFILTLSFALTLIAAVAFADEIGSARSDIRGFFGFSGSRAFTSDVRAPFCKLIYESDPQSTTLTVEDTRGAPISFTVNGMTANLIPGEDESPGLIDFTSGNQSTNHLRIEHLPGMPARYRARIENGFAQKDCVVLR